MNPSRHPLAAGVRRGFMRGLGAPGVAWLVVFFAIPLLVVIALGFAPRDATGRPELGFTLEHYETLFDPLYFDVLLRTVRYALEATGLSLLIAYPCAMAIVAATRWRRILLFLFVLPFWINFLIRTYALIFLLRDQGWINSALLWSGLIDEPLPLLYEHSAVVLGLVHGYLPFMLLPIYASLEKLDRSLLDAACVLGARPRSQFWRVTLPLSAPGVAAGCALVFIGAIGSFLTSDLLGGAKEVLAGNLIQNQFTSARNWPLGAAASTLLIALVVVASYLGRRAFATARSAP